MFGIGIKKKIKKNLNVGFFMDTVEARSFKLCMIITLLGVYIIMIGLMTLTLFQGNRRVRNKNCKLCVLDSCPLKFKYIKLPHTLKRLCTI